MMARLRRSGHGAGHAGPAVSFDGLRIQSRPGGTLGSCFLRAGVLVLRTSRTGQPRGLYCGIGVCNDCLVTVDEVPNIRACITPVVEGMTVHSQGGGSGPHSPTVGR